MARFTAICTRAFESLHFPTPFHFLFYNLGIRRISNRMGNFGSCDSQVTLLSLGHIILPRSREHPRRRISVAQQQAHCAARGKGNVRARRPWTWRWSAADGARTCTNCTARGAAEGAWAEELWPSSRPGRTGAEPGKPSAGC